VTRAIIVDPKCGSVYGQEDERSWRRSVTGEPRQALRGLRALLDSPADADPTLAPPLEQTDAAGPLVRWSAGPGRWPAVGRPSGSGQGGGAGWSALGHRRRPTGGCATERAAGDRRWLRPNHISHLALHPVFLTKISVLLSGTFCFLVPWTPVTNCRTSRGQQHRCCSCNCEPRRVWNSGRT